MGYLIELFSTLVDFLFADEITSIMLLLLAFVGYVTCYLLYGRGVPRFIGRHGKFADLLLTYCPSIREVYSPTFWCFTGRFQTMLRAILQRRINLKYRKDLQLFDDGGEADLDWYDNNDSISYPDPDTRPIVLLLPGLTGCSCDGYISQIVLALAEQGYRAAVFNNRGTCERMLKTPKTYCATGVTDVAHVVDYIHALYPKAPFTAIGVSLGGMILFNYLTSRGGCPRVSTSDKGTLLLMQEEAETGEADAQPEAQWKPGRCPLIACLIISVAWKVKESARAIERAVDWFLFNRILTRYLCNIVERNSDLLSKHFDVTRVLKSRTLREFDQHFTANMFDYPDVDAYYEAASLARHIHRIRVPVLCLTSEDDPLVPAYTLPLEEIAQSSHVTMALTRRGGHIGFLEGWFPRGAGFMGRVATDFMKLAFTRPNELRESTSDSFLQLPT